jgi:hypothetical protein
MSATVSLNPAQCDVLDALGAVGAERPRFEPELRHELRAELEQGLEPLADALRTAAAGGNPLHVSKHALAGVHGCEVGFLAEPPFAWSIPRARGSIAHKAIELSMHVRLAPVSLQIVDEAIARLAETETGLGEWLAARSEFERAELRASANESVAAFLETWPPLKPRWRPVTESRVKVELVDGAVVLQGKVDLTLGGGGGTTAGKVLVDLKTGGFAPHHRDDLRFYALLEAIKLGVPPRRVATYYLESARCLSEDVDTALLLTAARRVVDGVARLVALRSGGAEPVLRPGPPCHWCPIRDACPSGQQYLTREHDG